MDQRIDVQSPSILFFGILGLLLFLTSCEPRSEVFLYCGADESEYQFLPQQLTPIAEKDSIWYHNTDSTWVGRWEGKYFQITRRKPL